MIKNREDIREAVEYLLNIKLNDLTLDKVGSLFSFLVKAAYPLTDEDLKKLLKAVKLKVLMQTSEFSSIAA